MKIALQKVLFVVLALCIYSGSAAQNTAGPGISSTLNARAGLLVKQQIAFDVTATRGNAAADTRVKGRIIFTSLDFAGKRSKVSIEYLNTANTWTPLTISEAGVVKYGPETGFTLPNTTQFRLRADAASIYTYRLELIPVGGGEPLATTNEGITIDAVEQAIVNSTLDNVALERALVVNENIDFEVYKEAKDRYGDLVYLRMTLADPAQRSNITMQVVEIVDETPQLRPLEFNENGVFIVGTEAGEMLVDGREIFRINFSEPGTYAYKFEIVREDGTPLATINESVLVKATVTGVKDVIQNTRIIVYPTIAEGGVKIDLGTIRNARIAVVDVLGRTVVTLENANDSVHINTTGFTKGTYFVKVIKGNEMAINRFIVR